MASRMRSNTVLFMGILPRQRVHVSLKPRSRVNRARAVLPFRRPARESAPPALNDRTIAPVVRVAPARSAVEHGKRFGRRLTDERPFFLLGRSSLALFDRKL